MLNKHKISISTLIVIAAFMLALIASPFALQAQSTRNAQIYGVIEAVNTNSIIINRQQVDIRQATINAPLTVGTFVHITGVLNSNNVLVAQNITTPPVGVTVDEAQLVGTINSINGTQWTVGGTSVQTASAQITGTPALGQPVRVYATMTAPNTWQARVVEVIPAGTNIPSGNNLEITGTLQNIQGTGVTIAGQSIPMVNAQLTDPLIVGIVMSARVDNTNGAFNAQGFSITGNTPTLGTVTPTPVPQGQVNIVPTTQGQGRTPITVDQAITIALGVFPSSRVDEVELDSRFGGTLVWEIDLTNDRDVIIDANTGVILMIENDDDWNDSQDDDRFDDDDDWDDDDDDDDWDDDDDDDWDDDDDDDD